MEIQPRQKSLIAPGHMPCQPFRHSGAELLYREAVDRGFKKMLRMVCKGEIMIAVIDYQMGNIGSILNMLKKIGVPAQVTSDPEVIKKADKLILPGVGSYDTAMMNIGRLRLESVLSEKVLGDSIPILGICLGMQIMANTSEEGILPGLGWIDADFIRFRFPSENNGWKIPHMGWNRVSPVKDSKLFSAFPEDSRFYFVHSYYAVCKDQGDVLAVTHYGFEFVSAYEKRNIYGVQFHPEKSHMFGLQLFRNFAEI